MSLINDALRRAKEAQLQAPPSTLPGPHLKPVEPTQAARHSLGVLLPAGLAVVALCGLFFLWQLSRNNGLSRSQDVAARTPAPAAPTQPQPPVQPPAETKPAAVVPATEPAAPPRPLATVSNAATTAATALAPTDAPVPQGQAAATTNAPVVPPPPSPTPPRLRLQGIIFNPANPSATINGRTVFIGERIGAFRVVAIGHDSATIVGLGQTNVLSLGQ